VCLRRHTRNLSLFGTAWAGGRAAAVLALTEGRSNQRLSDDSDAQWSQQRHTAVAEPITATPSSL